MGWRPSEVRACHVAEFLAAFDGYIEFHGSQTKNDAMTRGELEDLMERYPDDG